MRKTNIPYIRDGRAPVPSDETISKVMSGNIGKDTKPELLLRKALWDQGIRGYRLHWKKAPGSPDICFPSKGVAVFVNGCFWHRCPNCNLPLPKINTAFWNEKFRKNEERDRRKIRQLEKAGWETLVIWECQIKRETQNCVEMIRNAIC